MANIVTAFVGETLDPHCSVSILHFPEAVTQTFIAGEFVYLNAGYLTICAAGDTAAIMGMALEPTHNAAAAGLYSIPVAIAKETTLFMLSESAAATPLWAIQAADLGASWNLLISAPGRWCINKDTAGGPGRIVRFRHAVGEQYGQVLVIINATHRQIN